MPSFYPEGNASVPDETNTRLLQKILGALTGSGQPNIATGIGGGGGAVGLTDAQLRATPLATTDSGATVEADRFNFTSADASAAAVPVTAIPTAGQKRVITDIFPSSNVEMELTFTEETTGTVFQRVFIGASVPPQFTPRGKDKLSTANTRLMVQASIVGELRIKTLSYSEA